MTWIRSTNFLFNRSEIEICALFSHPQRNIEINQEEINWTKYILLFWYLNEIALHPESQLTCSFCYDCFYGCCALIHLKSLVFHALEALYIIYYIDDTLFFFLFISIYLSFFSWTPKNRVKIAIFSINWKIKREKETQNWKTMWIEVERASK